MSKAGTFADEIFIKAQYYASLGYSTSITAINGLGDVSIPLVDYQPIGGSLLPPPNMITYPLPDEPTIDATIPAGMPVPPDLTAQQYYDDFLNAIRNWFMSQLVSPGTGIIQQQDIYGFEDARNAQILADTNARLPANPGPWSYPAGCLDAALSRFTFDYVNETLDVGRERRINNEAYTLAQIKFAISSGVELEKVLMMWWPKMAQSLAYMYGAGVSAWDVRVTASVAALDVVIKQYVAIVAAYEAQTSIQEGVARNYDRILDAEARAARVDADIVIAALVAQTSAAIRLASERREIIMEVAKSGEQICAGAMNAAHAQASINSVESYDSSQSTSYGESWRSDYTIQVSED